MKEYKKHPLNILPDCSKDDRDRLQGNIRMNGFDPKFPIVLFEGEILDGWQRYKICKENNIDFTTVEFEGIEEDAITFVRRSNTRRNLTKNQIAAFIVDSNGLLDRYQAEAEARKKNLGRTHGKDPSGSTTPRGRAVNLVAKDFGTEGDQVRRAKKLKKEDTKLFEQVKYGEKTLAKAEKEIKDRQPSGKIIKKKSDGPKSDPKLKKLSDSLNWIADNLQYLLQGDIKPQTDLDWGRLHTIRYSLYEIIRLAAAVGVNIAGIIENFNEKKIIVPKHLQTPKRLLKNKNMEVADIDYIEIKK